MLSSRGEEECQRDWCLHRWPGLLSVSKSGRYVYICAWEVERGWLACQLRTHVWNVWNRNCEIAARGWQASDQFSTMFLFEKWICYIFYARYEFVEGDDNVCGRSWTRTRRVMPIPRKFANWSTRFRHRVRFKRWVRSIRPRNNFLSWQFAWSKCQNFSDRFPLR